MVEREKVVYILPGFLQKPTENQYLNIGIFYQQHGIRPVPVEIDWRKGPFSSYVQTFQEGYPVNEGEERYIFGFSFGAIVAFLDAGQRSYKHALLSSLPAYFKEDIEFVKTRRAISKRWEEDIASLDFNLLATKVTGPVSLVVGQFDRPELIVRNQRLFELLSGTKGLTIVQGVGHDLSDPTYQKVVSIQVANLGVN